jgi:hypothetical protein
MKTILMIFAVAAAISASILSTTAASMQPGTWAQITAGNQNAVLGVVYAEFAGDDRGAPVMLLQQGNHLEFLHAGEMERPGLPAHFSPEKPSIASAWF